MVWSFPHRHLPLHVSVKLSYMPNAQQMCRGSGAAEWTVVAGGAALQSRSSRARFFRGSCMIEQRRGSSCTGFARILKRVLVSVTLCVRCCVCPLLCGPLRGVSVSLCGSVTLRVRYALCPLLCVSVTLCIRFSGYVCP